MSGFDLADNVMYKNVVGSSLVNRTAFDGSVPYCVSCSAIEEKNSTSVGDVVSTFFSVIGQANTGVSSTNARAGLVKQCSVDLRDIHFMLSGVGSYTVRITVCDPSSFPTSTDHVYLYENQVMLATSSVYELNIPDISGIVIVGSDAQPLNVCVQVTSGGSALRSISFHCVAVIDD